MTIASNGQPVRGRGMKRLLAILVFVMGGFAAELAAPLQCTLMPAGSVARLRPSLKRRKV